MFITRDPLLIMFIEILQILELDIELKVPVSFRDLLNKLRDVGPQIDQKVGRFNKADHRIIDIEIALVVAIVDVTTGMKIGGEDVCVFVDRTVLDHGSRAFADLANLVETAIQKIDLQMERPLCHVAIEIAEIWVLVDRLEQRCPAVVLRQLVGERAFAGADVTGDSYMFDFFQWAN